MNKMKTEKYTAQKNRLPQTGKQVIAQTDGENMIVYQAFNPRITDYAVAHQQFGGPDYSFSRMSWIKPGFLWMMYRAGWAAKEDQQRILAITVPITHFKTILQQATLSSFDSQLYAAEANWKSALAATEVRLQWDPDHDPYGNKQERKAIQIGLKGECLKNFCTKWLVKIEDITDFVKQEHEKLLKDQLADLLVPIEDVLDLNDDVMEQKIGIQKK
jgi:Domain of unknown function (DUF4291)